MPGFEPHVRRIDDVAIDQVELDELLSRSDIVSVEALSAKADIALRHLEDFLGRLGPVS